MSTRHVPITKIHMKLPKEIKASHVLNVYTNTPEIIQVEGYSKKILDIEDYQGEESLLKKCRNTKPGDGHKAWVELKT